MKKLMLLGLVALLSVGCFGNGPDDTGRIKITRSKAASFAEGQAEFEKAMRRCEDLKDRLEDDKRSGDDLKGDIEWAARNAIGVDIDNLRQRADSMDVQWAQLDNILYQPCEEVVREDRLTEVKDLWDGFWDGFVAISSSLESDRRLFLYRMSQNLDAIEQGNRVRGGYEGFVSDAEKARALGATDAEIRKRFDRLMSLATRGLYYPNEERHIKRDGIDSWIGGDLRKVLNQS